MSFYVLINFLSGCSVSSVFRSNATNVCSVCFMKNKNAFEKGEMGQAETQKWDKSLEEVGQMRLPVIAVKTAPDSVAAGPEPPQQVQTGPDRTV